MENYNKRYIADKVESENRKVRKYWKYYLYIIYLATDDESLVF